LTGQILLNQIATQSGYLIVPQDGLEPPAYALGAKLFPKKDWGILQFVYVNPDKNIIIVRLGTSRGGLEWDEWKVIFSSLAQALDE
jgi:hypothetical protein